MFERLEKEILCILFLGEPKYLRGVVQIEILQIADILTVVAIRNPEKNLA
jgi:hypothetical protein